MQIQKIIIFKKFIRVYSVKECKISKQEGLEEYNGSPTENLSFLVSVVQIWLDMVVFILWLKTLAQVGNCLHSGVHDVSPAGRNNHQH